MSGFLSNKDLEAGSVARAGAAKVSMMMLIQSSWTAERMDSSVEATVDMKMRITVVMLTEIWNQRTS